MSCTTCPIFRPTLEEFKDFKKYVRKIEKESTSGICKVIPPTGWWTFDYEALDLTKLVVPTPVRQAISGRAGIFNVDLFEMPSMTAAELKALDARVALDEPSFAERERKFWRSMGTPHPQWTDPIYGADMVGSLFGDDEASSWNLNNLDSILTLIGSNLPGITSSYMYVGMWRALFAFHCEDMDLYSINYLHTGACKSWYSIPLAYKQRFESMAQSYFTAEFRQCNQFLRHKTKMFSPSKVKESGLECVTVLQEPGEFVVTFPGCYHAGFSHGFNIAEATNFGTPSWLETGRKAKHCVCRPHSVSIDIDLLQTLWLRQVFVVKGAPTDKTFPRRMRCACGVTALVSAGGSKSALGEAGGVFPCAACFLWCHRQCVLLAPAAEGAVLLCHICQSLENDGTWAARGMGPAALSGAAHNPKESKTKKRKPAPAPSLQPQQQQHHQQQQQHHQQHHQQPQTPQPQRIAIKSEVAVLLPGAQEETFGYIVDIEGSEADGLWGRLHVKGKKKELDVWVPFDDNIRLVAPAPPPPPLPPVATGIPPSPSAAPAAVSAPAPLAASPPSAAASVAASAPPPPSAASDAKRSRV